MTKVIVQLVDNLKMKKALILPAEPHQIWEMKVHRKNHLIRMIMAHLMVELDNSI